MTFLEFYDAHFISVTIMITIGTCILVGFIIMLFKTIFKKNVKTPWFEIAPDSVKVPESEDMAKTRLLLKRQFEYVDHYIDGVSNTFLSFLYLFTNLSTIYSNRYHIIKNAITIKISVM